MSYSSNLNGIKKEEDHNVKKECILVESDKYRVITHTSHIDKWDKRCKINALAA